MTQKGHAWSQFYASELANYGGICYSQELTEQHVAKNSPAAITRVACSMTGRHVAACDAHNTVLLYAHVAFKQTMRWEFVGKARGHQGEQALPVTSQLPCGDFAGLPRVLCITGRSNFRCRHPTTPRHSVSHHTDYDASSTRGG